MGNLFLYKINGGIPLNIGAKCKYQFIYLFMGNSVHEQLNAQLIGANSIQGRYNPPQHMICSIELLGTFDGYYISDIFYYTNDLLIAHGIGANGTGFAITYIVAAFAKLYIPSHFCNRVSKQCYIVDVLF